MRVRQMSATGDYTFGQSQANFLINSAAAVAQCIQTALGLMQGEWFLDNTKGTPYGAQILGFGTSGLYDQAIQNVILNVPGVTQITDYESSLDGELRSLSVDGIAQTSFGPVPFSAVVGLPVQPPTPLEFTGVACDGQVRFTWAQVPGTTYNLYRGEVTGGIVPLPIAVNLVDGATIVPATDGVEFFYALCAVVGGVISEPTAEVSVIALALGTPIATPTAGAESVALTWTTAAGAVSYAVFVGTAPGEETATPVFTGDGLSTNVTGLTTAQAYYFVVAAINACGQTIKSTEVTATPS